MQILEHLLPNVTVVSQPSAVAKGWSKYSELFFSMKPQFTGEPIKDMSMLSFAFEECLGPRFRSSGELLADCNKALFKESIKVYTYVLTCMAKHSYKSEKAGYLFPQIWAPVPTVSAAITADSHLRHLLLAPFKTSKRALSVLYILSTKEGQLSRFPDMRMEQRNMLTPFYWLVCEANGMLMPRGRLTLCAACGQSSYTLVQCKVCRNVKYCGAECQTAHWKTHKPDCRACSQVLPMWQEPASLLLEYGANVNAVDTEGRNLLHVATRHIVAEHVPALVQFLLEAGIQADATDKAGEVTWHEGIRTMINNCPKQWVGTVRSVLDMLFAAAGISIEQAVAQYKQLEEKRAQAKKDEKFVELVEYRCNGPGYTRYLENFYKDTPHEPLSTHDCLWDDSYNCEDVSCQSCYIKCYVNSFHYMIDYSWYHRDSWLGDPLAANSLVATNNLVEIQRRCEVRQE
jgi:hypothetical protein